MNKLYLDYPAYFPEPIPAPIRNELTIEGAALGRDLFFDPTLSADHQISCASCHQPEYSFSDGKKFSTGHSGNRLKRNTPALINLAWSADFFWDGGVKNLESLSFAALMNPDEMGTNLSALCKLLNERPTYRAKFKIVFDTDSITSAHISRALAQYLRTIVSASAKYDSVQLELSTFSNQEKEGQKVFENNCAVCHKPPLFVDGDFHHNGLRQIYSSDDLYVSTGRFRISRDSADLGKYKTPTLRNLGLTAPYMHDGRFESIEEVLAHYQNIDTVNQHQDKLVEMIDFSEKEKLSLIAFLKTLDAMSFDNIQF